MKKGFAQALTTRHCWQQEKFDLVQSHERIAGCDILPRREMVYIAVGYCNALGFYHPYEVNYC